MSAWEALTLLLVAALLWRFFSKQVIGDVEMMCLGTIVYISSPMVIYARNWLEDGPGISTWHAMFGPAAAAESLLLAFTVAFACAYGVGRTWAIKTPRRMDRPFSHRMLFMLSGSLWTGWLAVMTMNYASLGGGYSVEVETSVLGQLGTANLMLMLFVLNCRQYGRNKGGVYASLCLLLALNSMALLSLGGRMYVLAAAIALGLQSVSKTTSFRQRWKILLSAVAVLGLLIFIGVWRVGGEQDTSFFAFIAAAEGLFTSMSLGSFVRYNGIPAIAFPSNFIGSVINFIPSAFIEDKSLVIPTIQESGWFFEAPLGATNLFVALFGNFGWIGSLFFALGFGWVVGSIRRVNTRGWWLYFYISALLPFMFFRDGFSIFNKAAFFNGIILPYVILVIDRLFWPMRRRRVRPDLPAPAWLESTQGTMARQTRLP